MTRKAAGSIVLEDGEIVGETECKNLEEIMVPECKGLCEDGKVSNQTCSARRLHATQPFTKYTIECKGKRNTA